MNIFGVIYLGSRVMHCIISNQLIEQLNIKGKASFLLGGIAADASTNKEISHFFEGKHEDYTRKIAYEKFYKKYQDHENQAYILGYYAHLISDHIWLTGFYLPWLKNRIENDPAVQEKYHYDFSLLNRKLPDYYNLTVEELETMDVFDIPHLEEISPDHVKKLFSALKEDLRSTKNELLKVFTFDQIIGYIETSITISKRKISNKNSLT